MSIPDPAGLKPLDLAKAEIDAWRGRCLNIFSRGEKAVTDCLLGAARHYQGLRLEPLAGQRLKRIEMLAEESIGTKAQKSALTHAIQHWQTFDEKRPFFSHGVVTELVDRKGHWHVRLDFVAVQKGKCQPRSLVWSKADAEHFEASLHEAFKALARDLGQFRKRLPDKT